MAYLLLSKRYKLQHLQALVEEEGIQVLCLQETGLPDDIMKVETQISGYNNYRQDRGGGRKGGGMGPYISTSLRVTEHDSYSNIVCDAVYTKVQELNLPIINLYRPPSADNKFCGSH